MNAGSVETLKKIGDNCSSELPKFKQRAPNLLEREDALDVEKVEIFL